MLQYLRVLILQVMSGKGLLHSYNHSPYRLICYCYISYVCFHGRKLLVFKWNLFFLNHIKKLYLLCKWLHSRQNISLGYFQSGVVISKTSQREGPGFESTCVEFTYSPRDFLPPQSKDMQLVGLSQLVILNWPNCVNESPAVSLC